MYSFLLIWTDIQASPPQIVLLLWSSATDSWAVMLYREPRCLKNLSNSNMSKNIWKLWMLPSIVVESDGFEPSANSPINESELLFEIVFPISCISFTDALSLTFWPIIYNGAILTINCFALDGIFTSIAGSEGFEPPDHLAAASGFQDRCNQPDSANSPCFSKNHLII